jgi:hypothetical protein
VAAAVRSAAAGLCALLAEGAAVATVRNAFPAAERAHLALLTVPVAGICAIAVAVTYCGGPAVDAAAIADVIALAGIAAITARTGSAGRFAVVCAVTGFVLAPAAGAVTALTAPTQSTTETGGAVLAAAGLVLLLAGLVAGYLAAGAVQLRALTGATAVPAAHAALATAAGHWTLTAAAVAGAVALVLACIGGRRTGG